MVACEATREIGKPQHRVDRGEADRRDGQHGARHQPVEDELRELGRARDAISFDELELAASHPIEAELAVQDVADVGEVARAAGARRS